MQRADRTTKKLAQRIDLSYFKYSHPFRRWRLWLSIAVPAMAGLWLVWNAVAGEKAIYTAGPVSESHVVVGDRCDTCHVKQEDVFREHVTDLACLACHDGPIHTIRQAVRGNEVITPECSGCHVEHKGLPRLAEVDDRNCIVCHGNLTLQSATPGIVRAIGGFNSGHPEFEVLREKKPDPGTIQLNHFVHLRPGLRGPKGQVQMTCTDCHRTPAMRAAWPFGEPKLRTITVKVGKPGPFTAPAPGRYMEPVEYAQACEACHQLEFDKRIVDSVPHASLVEVKDDPVKVHRVARAFMERKFREYLAQHPGAWREVETPPRRIPGKPYVVEPPARSPQEWLGKRMAEAETLLWNKTCKLCHTVRTPAGSNVPQVAKANLTVQWMKRSVFDHEAHRMMTCESCHAATNSKESADVLMPGIATCQQCHRPGRAESRCFECHAYHDWSQKQPTKGKYSIEQLLHGVETPAPAPAPAPAKTSEK